MSEEKLTLEFEATGERWDRITEFDIEDDFLVPSDAWSITVVDDQDPVGLRRKFRPLEPVRLYLGERLQLIGRIDGHEGVGGGSSALRVWGRDYLAELVDPNIDPSIRVTSGMSLADALLAGLGVFGITDIQGDVDAARAQKMGPVRYRTEQGDARRYIDGLSPDTQAMAQLIPPREVRTPVTEEVPDAKPKDNEGAFEWANRLAARAGFTIQPGTARNAVAVVAPDYRNEAAFRLAYPGNIKHGRARRDWGSLPTVVITSGRFVTAGLEAKGQWREVRTVGDDSPSALWQTEEGRRSLQDVGVVSARLRPGSPKAADLLYRPLYYRDDEAKTAEQLERSARRMLADRMRKTLEYTATMAGFSDPFTGTTYGTNVMAHVVDEVEDVNELLWIQSRRISHRDGGSSCELKLIRPASFVL